MNIILTWLFRVQVHKLCQESAERILNDFKPHLMIAIGGGGYVPARILRCVIQFESCVSPCSSTYARLDIGTLY